MLEYILDTNICIEIIKTRPVDTLIVEKFNLNSSKICISSITVMELYWGLCKSEINSSNNDVIESFISRLKILEYDTAAAQHTARIRSEINPNVLGAYDAMIAGHARSRGLVVVTNNVGVFQCCDGIRLEDWSTR